jgi:Concanavalin A-like lectin/glucanases superfamily
MPVQNNLIFAWRDQTTSNIYVSTATNESTTGSSYTPTGQWTQGQPAVAFFNQAYWVAFLAAHPTTGTTYILICSCPRFTATTPSWSSSNQNTGLSAKAGTGVAMCVFGSNLYMAYVDANNNLYCACSSNGTTWTATSVPSQASSYAPSLAVLNNTLWMAWQSTTKSNDIVVCSSSNGTTWSGSIAIPGQSCNWSPSLAAWNGSLWVAFASNDSNKAVLVCYSANPGVASSWSTDYATGQTTQTSPALAALDTELWIAFQAKSFNNILCITSANGTTWSPNTSTSYSGPPCLAAATSRGMLPDSQFTQTYAASVSQSGLVPTTFQYTATVLHQGTVVAFAMDTNAPPNLYYSVLYFDNPNITGVLPDADYWFSADAGNNAPTSLVFPTEIRKEGFGSFGQIALQATTASGAGGTTITQPTTGLYTQSAPFQVLSDGTYIYLFRQSNQKGTTVSNTSSGVNYTFAANALLVDRFMLSGGQLSLLSEVRFQRSRSKDFPASNQDSLSPTDMNGNPFIEPTHELALVQNWKSFAVALVPTQTGGWRWQILAQNNGGWVDSFSVLQASDGLFDFAGPLTFACPNQNHAYVQSLPGTCGQPCGQPLLPSGTGTYYCPTHLTNNTSTSAGYCSLTCALTFAEVPTTTTADSCIALGNQVMVDLGSFALPGSGGSFTIEFWCQRQCFQNRGYVLLNQTGGLQLGFAQPGAFECTVPTPALMTYLVNNDLLWHHYALVFAGSTSSSTSSTGLRSLYKDGVLYATDTTAVTLPSAAHVYLGATTTSLGVTAPVNMDELRFWGVALSQAEIQTNMRSRAVGNEGALQHYFRFDEASGTTLHDSAGTAAGTVYPTQINVSGATNANPTVITVTSTSTITSGSSVTIAGVGGNTGANGTWVATVLPGGTTFSIPANTTGGSSYTSGGTVSPACWISSSAPLGQAGSLRYERFFISSPSGSNLLGGNLDAELYYLQEMLPSPSGGAPSLQQTTARLMLAFDTAATMNVSSATNASPTVITVSSTSTIANGSSVTIAGVGGNTGANGTWVATVLSSTTFSIPANTTAGSSYTSGGTVSVASTVGIVDFAVAADGQLAQAPDAINLSTMPNPGALNFISMDGRGLDVYGATLGFAANSAGATSPTLFDSVTGAMTLYWNGSSNQLAWAGFNTTAARTQIQIQGSAGYLQFVAKADGADYNDISVSITGSSTLTVTMSHAGYTETWTGVPTDALCFAAVLDNQPLPPLQTGGISGATNASPTVITVTSTSTMVSGSTVMIAGVGGNTGANGTWIATVLSGTTFSIPVNTTGASAYTSGGTVTGSQTYTYAGQVTTTRADANLGAGSLLVAVTAVPFAPATTFTVTPTSGAVTYTATGGVAGQSAAWQLPAAATSISFTGTPFPLVSSATPPSPTQDLTLEAWVNPSSSCAAQPCIINQSMAGTSGYYLAVGLGTGACVTGSIVKPGVNVAATSMGALPTGQWSHVAAVFYQKGAVLLDGKAGYLDCGNDPSLSLTSDLTIEVWLQLLAAVPTSGTVGICSKGLLGSGTGTGQNATVSHVPYALYIDDGTLMFAYSRSDGMISYAVGPAFPTDSKPHCVAVTRQCNNTQTDVNSRTCSWEVITFFLDGSAWGLRVYTQTYNSGPKGALNTHAGIADDGGDFVIGRVGPLGVSYGNGTTGMAAANQTSAPQLTSTGTNANGVTSTITLPPVGGVGLNAWSADTAYTAGTFVTSNGNFYSAGSTATSGSTAPSGTTTSSDGTITWTYVPAIAGLASPPGSLDTPVTTLNGLISQVRLWGSALAPSLVGQPFVTTQGTPAGQWIFEERQGLQSADTENSNSSPAMFMNGVTWAQSEDINLLSQAWTIYVNGQWQPSSPFSQSSPVIPGLTGPCTTTGFCLGGLVNVSANAYTGQLAEVRIWGMSRTQSQILDNLHRPLDRSSTGILDNPMGLLAYYTLDSISSSTSTTILDRSGMGANLTCSTQSTAWTAPVDPELPEGWSSFGVASSSGAPATLACPLGVAEYGVNEIDAYGNMTGALKRCYNVVQQGQWLLTNGLKVGPLAVQWVGQVQFAPTLIGYIEGAPPVPGENMIQTGLSYQNASSVQLTIADQVVYTYTANRNKGFNFSMTTTLQGGYMGNTMVGLGVYEGVANVEAFIGGQEQNSYGTSQQDGVSPTTGLSQSQLSQMSLDAYYYDAQDGLGPRHVPRNVGYALVKSSVADQYALLLPTTGAVIGYQLVVNPNIPPDWNIITFQINPYYIRQGCLDGQFGIASTWPGQQQGLYGQLVNDPHFPAAGGTADASYRRVNEAYALKSQISKEEQQIANQYASYNAVGIGERTWSRESLKSGNLSKAAEMTQENSLDALIESPDTSSASSSSSTDPTQLIKRNLCNTYLWTAYGGFFAETEQTLDGFTETLGGSYNVSLRQACGLAE